MRYLPLLLLSLLAASPLPEANLPDDYSEVLLDLVTVQRENLATLSGLCRDLDDPTASHLRFSSRLNELRLARVADRVTALLGSLDEPAKLAEAVAANETDNAAFCNAMELQLLYLGQTDDRFNDLAEIAAMQQQLSEQRATLMFNLMETLAAR